MAANEFNIDPNVWYQISNERFDPSADSLRVGDSHTAIYMFGTNLTSPQQRWQIFPVSDGGGWNFRAQITGSGAYMSQCEQLTSTTASTDAIPDNTDVCMALGAATDIQRRWILSSNGDGTFDIKLNNTNPLYSDYHLVNNATNVVAFTNDTTEEGVKWAFQSIMKINDPAFSTGIVATSTTQSVTATSTSASGSSTGTNSSQTSSTPTNTSLASTSSKSSGLSSGASAGIGIGVALLVLALAALAFFLFRRRRRQHKRVHELPHDAYHQSHSPQDQKVPYQDAVYHTPPSELHDQSVAELDQTPSSQRPIAELGTDRASRSY